MDVRIKAVNAVKRIYPRWGMRASDIILASFPKSGNTWTRFIWANMVSLMEWDGRLIDYHLLNGALVAEYDTHKYGSFDYRRLPRLVKTHRPYSPRRFGKNKAVYIYRNPGDVMVSYYHYLRGMKTQYNTLDDDFSFDVLIRDDQYGLPAWARHLSGWLEHAEVSIAYEALKADAVSCLQKIFATLHLPAIPDDVIVEAVARADIKNVKRFEQEKGLDPSAQEVFRPDFRFARNGAVGQWKAYFTEKDEHFLHDILVTYGLADLYHEECGLPA